MIFYKCPDDNLIPLEKCIENCRMKTRCVPLFILKSFYFPTEDLETFHVTDLLMTPLQFYLKRQVALKEKDLVISPQRLSRPFFGQMVHSFLRNVYKKGIRERKYVLKLNSFKIIGQIDLLEEDTIFDYKTVAPEFIQHIRNLKLPLREEWVKQLHFYYYILTNKKKKIKNLRLILVAPSSSEEFFWYPVDVPLPPSLYDIRIEIFQRINERYYYLSNKILPKMCEDTWGLKRCERYCFYSEICDYYQSLKSLDNFKVKVLTPDERISAVIDLYLEAKERLKREEAIVEEAKEELKRYLIENRCVLEFKGKRVYLKRKFLRSVDWDAIPQDLIALFVEYKEYYTLNISNKEEKNGRVEERD